MWIVFTCSETIQRLVDPDEILQTRNTVAKNSHSAVQSNAWKGSLGVINILVGGRYSGKRAEII